jgi:hypothetical protein
MTKDYYVEYPQLTNSMLACAVPPLDPDINPNDRPSVKQAEINDWSDPDWMAFVI